MTHGSDTRREQKSPVKHYSISERLRVFNEKEARKFIDLLMSSDDLSDYKYFCVALEIKMHQQTQVSYSIFCCADNEFYIGLNVTSRGLLRRFVSNLYKDYLASS